MKNRAVMIQLSDDEKAIKLYFQPDTSSYDSDFEAVAVADFSHSAITRIIDNYLYKGELPHEAVKIYES